MVAFSGWVPVIIEQFHILTYQDDILVVILYSFGELLPLKKTGKEEPGISK